MLLAGGRDPLNRGSAGGLAAPAIILGTNVTPLASSVCRKRAWACTGLAGSSAPPVPLPSPSASHGPDRTAVVATRRNRPGQDRDHLASRSRALRALGSRLCGRDGPPEPCSARTSPCNSRQQRNGRPRLNPRSAGGLAFRVCTPSTRPTQASPPDTERHRKRVEIRRGFEGGVVSRAQSQSRISSQAHWRYACVAMRHLRPRQDQDLLAARTRATRCLVSRPSMAAMDRRNRASSLPNARVQSDDRRRAPAPRASLAFAADPHDVRQIRG